MDLIGICVAGRIKQEQTRGRSLFPKSYEKKTQRLICSRDIDVSTVRVRCVENESFICVIGFFLKF